MKQITRRAEGDADEKVHSTFQLLVKCRTRSQGVTSLSLDRPLRSKILNKIKPRLHEGFLGGYYFSNIVEIEICIFLKK